MLLEDDAVKGIQDPRDYVHVKLLRFTLKLLGSWPGRELKEKSVKYETGPLYFLMVIKLSCLYLTVLFLKRHSQSLSFFELGHVYITIFMTFVTLSRGFSLPLNPKYRNVITKFFTKMHLFYHKETSDFAMETHVKVHKISHFFSLFLKFQMLAGLTLFNIIPIYNNWSSGKFDNKYLYNETYDLSIYYEVPFDILTNLNGYIGICAFNWYASYICCNFFCMFDLVLSLMIFTVSGHFKILIHNLNHFPLPAVASGSQIVNKNSIIADVQLYSATEMDGIAKRLKYCIDYHRVLVEFTNEMSDAFGPMLFAYYMFHQISGCLLLLECSQMDAEALIRYGPLTLVLFQQLIQLSVIIESVGTVTGKLKDAVYSVPWEYMDASNRRTTAIFLMNVQEPLHVNALGLAKVGVQSMAAILKTSFSYFAFLRSISE